MTRKTNLDEFEKMLYYLDFSKEDIEKFEKYFDENNTPIENFESFQEFQEYIYS